MNVQVDISMRRGSGNGEAEDYQTNKDRCRYRPSAGPSRHDGQILRKVFVATIIEFLLWLICTNCQRPNTTSAHRQAYSNVPRLLYNRQVIDAGTEHIG
jgi:hypothetical protein